MGAVLLLSMAFPVVRAEFIPWTNGENNTVFAHYADFRQCDGQYPGPFTNADRGTFHPHLPDTSLTENTGQGFITSTGHIYSPVVPLDFTVTAPNYGYSTSGGAWTTYVFIQIRTLGNELNYQGLTLSYNDGTGEQTLNWNNAIDTQELHREANPFGGFDVETLVIFKMPYNPDSFIVHFAAADVSMSLAQFRVDTITVTLP